MKIESNKKRPTAYGRESTASLLNRLLALKPTECLRITYAADMRLINGLWMPLKKAGKRMTTRADVNKKDVLVWVTTRLEENGSTK